MIEDVCRTIRACTVAGVVVNSRGMVSRIVVNCTRVRVRVRGASCMSVLRKNEWPLVSSMY